MGADQLLVRGLPLNLSNIVRIAGTKNTPGFNFLNQAMAFDIETTTIETDHPVAFMWCWQMATNGTVKIGRTWGEFELLIEDLTKCDFHVDIFIHNAGFEFSFIGRRFKWDKVFARGIREPIFFEYKN